MNTNFYKFSQRMQYKRLENVAKRVRIVPSYQLKTLETFLFTDQTILMDYRLLK